MSSLSEQLDNLSDHAKQAQDFVAAARQKNRDFLDRQRETLKSSMSDTKAKVESGTAAAQDKAESWWDDTRSAIDARLASLRAERDQHRAERDLKKAERRADEAEQDAADAVSFAIAMLDQAEYAIADAVLARGRPGGVSHGGPADDEPSRAALPARPGGRALSVSAAARSARLLS